MAVVYTPPSVTIEELTSPSISPILAVPTTVCLVGATQGYQTGTAQVVFGTGTTPKTLTVPTNSKFLKVQTTQTFVSAKDAIDPSLGATDQTGYVEGASGDYTATVSSDGTTVTITPVSGKAIATNGATVNFVYRYVPNDYYTAIRLDSLAAIEARFGAAYDPANPQTVGTPLSYAAGLAFENGASTVVVQPLFELTDPSDPASARLQPDATGLATVSTWQESFYALRDYEDVNIITPVVGQSVAGIGDATQLSIIEALEDHIVYMKNQGQYVIGIVGEDSSLDSTKATPTILRNHATTIRGRYGGDVAEQMVFVSPTRFTRALPSNNNLEITVGGQYAAAAIGGMIAARPVTSTLTRKQISGFQTVAETRSRGDKDADASAGLLVIEQKGLAVQVRHAITTSDASVATRELSVVRAKHRMIESLRDTLDTQVIGQTPADGNAPIVVKTAVIGVLEQLRLRRELVDYSGVEARTLALDPTTVECRFSYRPAFPLNYVHVKFSLDLTTAEVNVGIGESTLT